MYVAVHWIAGPQSLLPQGVENRQVDILSFVAALGTEDRPGGPIFFRVSPGGSAHDQVWPYLAFLE